MARRILLKVTQLHRVRFRGIWKFNQGLCGVRVFLSVMATFHIAGCIHFDLCCDLQHDIEVAVEQCISLLVFVALSFRNPPSSLVV